MVHPFADRVVAVLTAEELSRGFELELAPDSAAARHLRPVSPAAEAVFLMHLAALNPWGCGLLRQGFGGLSVS